MGSQCPLQQTVFQQLTKRSALRNLRRFNCFQHDHGKENANLCLERVPELGHQSEEDAAGQGKGLWDGGCAVLQQTEAQVLLDSRAELLTRSEHFATVLKQYHQQLKGQDLHQDATNHSITFTQHFAAKLHKLSTQPTHFNVCFQPTCSGSQPL